MVPNLDAMDASDRLRKFKQTFEVNKGKWDNYSSGEELFGLAVTKYPELEDIQARGAQTHMTHAEPAAPMCRAGAAHRVRNNCVQSQLKL